MVRDRTARIECIQDRNRLGVGCGVESESRIEQRRDNDARNKDNTNLVGGTVAVMECKRESTQKLANIQSETHKLPAHCRAGSMQHRLKHFGRVIQARSDWVREGGLRRHIERNEVIGQEQSHVYYHYPETPNGVFLFTSNSTATMTATALRLARGAARSAARRCTLFNSDSTSYSKLTVSSHSPQCTETGHNQS